MAKRRKKKQKAKELTQQNIIDIDARREERRLKLRAEAEAERARRGEKSIMQEMMDDMARGDERFERNKKEDEAFKRSKRRREKKKKGAMSAQKKISVIVIIVVLAALIFSVGNIIKLEIQQNEAERRMAELETEKADLEKQVNQIGTDTYMEKQAREWLKMAKQGELIYVYDDNEGTAKEDTTKQDDTKQNE